MQNGSAEEGALSLSVRTSELVAPLTRRSIALQLLHTIYYASIETVSPAIRCAATSTSNAAASARVIAEEQCASRPTFTVARFDQSYVITFKR
jgi:hypothetical protein